jgi:outer membrane protein OmpA-like peptidoglycan-associated protein/tetratricopeptide (TPR) repeat protein
MKKIVLLSITLILSFVSFSQAYSTKNKKAIKLFKKAMEAPRIVPNDFKSGESYCLKAIMKDPKFVEAYILSAEYNEYLGNTDVAVSRYKKAIEVNPKHSPSGATYFFLGNLLAQKGEAEEALFYLNEFKKFPNANQKLVTEATKLIESSTFLIESKKNPSAFEPVNMGSQINTNRPEYFPTITVDGKTFLFTRRLESILKTGEKYEQEDFFYSNLNNINRWETAIAMPSNINTIRNEGAPTISGDGKSLVFVACSLGDFIDYGEGRDGKGSCDMFYTKKIGQRWLDPINLPGKVNTNLWESQPSISADGKTMYFVRRANAIGSLDNSDIYTSTMKPDGSWDAPIRLPDNINTPLKEESVFIHPDGNTLYFSSNGLKGMGGLDIFISRKNAKGEWGNPENLGYPINTPADENSLLVNAEGDIAFFASSREGGFGDLDIYYFLMPDQFKPTKTVYFDGKVFDASTKLPLGGKIVLKDIKTGIVVFSSEADKVNGSFTVALPINQEYALSVEYPGYAFFSENFNLTMTENQTEYHKDVPLNSILNAPAVALKNVFYDLGKATLRPESFVELNLLRDFLKTNEVLKIELSGHTDTRGDAMDNLKLSDARAKSVVDYLISQGIESRRLTGKGYGESKPIITDEKINALNSEIEKEKAHQENRRTEYVILKPQ